MSTDPAGLAAQAMLTTGTGPETPAEGRFWRTGVEGELTVYAQHGPMPSPDDQPVLAATSYDVAKSVVSDHNAGLAGRAITRLAQREEL